MKNTNTKNTTTTSAADRLRFNFLRTLFHQAPLKSSELTELTNLAKVFDPKLAKWIAENPGLC